jgi:hypothetical protein
MLKSPPNASDGARSSVSIDGDGDRVTRVELTANRTGDGDCASRFCRIEYVVASDAVDTDGRYWCGGVNSVALCCRGRAWVTCSISGRDARINGGVWVSC